MQNDPVFAFNHATYSAPTEWRVRQSLNVATTARTSGALTTLETIALIVAVVMALYPLAAFTWGTYFGAPAA